MLKSRRALSLSLYIYMYIYILFKHIHIYIYVCIYSCGVDLVGEKFGEDGDDARHRAGPEGLALHVVLSLSLSLSRSLSLSI